MRNVLIAGLSMAVLAAGLPALAATPAPPPPGAAAAPAPAPMPPSGPDAATPGAPGQPGAMPPAPPPPGDQADDVGAPPPPPPRGGRRPPPPSPAAHFHVGHGDSVIDIKCADNEPTRACVDAAIQLLDHMTLPRP